MCGFAAYFSHKRKFSKELLDLVEKDLFHRGPDAGDSICKENYSLVFRRLSIIDPRPESDQPMVLAKEKLSIVFNGEIYNYKALRKELEGKGVCFNTTGDTEVILQGYQFWGEEVVDHLEGMFSFVIVDGNNNCAIAARDPFGIKPLYLYKDNTVIALSSEIKPLLRLTQAEIDEQALAEHLMFGWAAGELSNYKNIIRVKGGTLLKIKLEKNAVESFRYYDILDTISPNNKMSVEEAETIAHNELLSSIKKHLVSDVGYTLQLSGGVDSSLIAAITAKESNRRISSFSVKLEDVEHDESEYRKEVVERYDLDHHEVLMTGQDFADALPDAVLHMEGPISHMGSVMLMMLCKHIKQKSKVVLTGEGADEMFGGYERYEKWKKYRTQELVAKYIPRSLLPNKRPFLGVHRIYGKDAAVYASVYHDIGLMERLFPALSVGKTERELASDKFSDFRDRIYASDLTAYLESLLVRQDKMSMANSVEARVPFVDVHFAKVINSIPRHIKTPGGVTKPLLKRIAEKYLPESVIYR